MSAEPNELRTQTRRWWQVDYRPITRRPDWFRLREVDLRERVQPLVEYWTGRGCDVRVTEVLEVVTRTTTRGEPVTSSPGAGTKNL